MPDFLRLSFFFAFYHEILRLRFRISKRGNVINNHVVYVGFEQSVTVGFGAMFLNSYSGGFEFQNQSLKMCTGYCMT